MDVKAKEIERLAVVVELALRPKVPVALTLSPGVTASAGTLFRIDGVLHATEHRATNTTDQPLVVRVIMYPLADQ